MTNESTEIYRREEKWLHRTKEKDAGKVGGRDLPLKVHRNLYLY